MEQIFPGIWKMTLGEPESFTPVRLRYFQPAGVALRLLPEVPACPFSETGIAGNRTRRGYTVQLDLDAEEQVYGFGLQFFSLNQRRSKKVMRVNSDPRVDLGDSHAPVPFYVSTQGYGVLVDTARYATFYTASAVPRAQTHGDTATPRSLDDLIDHVNRDRHGPMIIDIPAAPGVDLYIFGGPGMLTAVQRYNLFSGGGCLPPRWGLGVWYRGLSSFNQQQILSLAERLRQDKMPCDVLGLEPGWQTHAYSCSFAWSESFPEPAQMVQQLAQQHFHVNNWTHAFIHPSSPLYQKMLPYSGSHEVWDGLVPDLVLPEARRIMADYFGQEHVDLGISGYKLDECDNSDFNTTYWSFPDVSTFPSGVDGEQMHSLFGLKFQEMVETIHRQRNLRTYGGVRSSHALAAPNPFVLYSDLYSHQDFIRALVSSGFSGLLWTPEVRDASSEEDLIRRLQSVVFSPQALINAWYIANPPWKQWRMKENNAGQFTDNWKELEAACRKILELRMQLIPYLYAAFYRYHMEGIPPFRAPVLEDPQDANLWKIDNQYMVGDRLLVAPVTAGQHERSIYLPQGQWYDFWNGSSYTGKQTYTLPVPLDIIPVFVKDGAVLPLAQPTLHTEDSAGYQLTVRVYGDGHMPCVLYEDDGTILDYCNGKYNQLEISWDTAAKTGRLVSRGDTDCPHYSVTAWQRMGV